MSEVLDRYSNTLNSLSQYGALKLSDFVAAAQSFSDEDKLCIASNLGEIFTFNTSCNKRIEMLAHYIKSIHPEADISWLSSVSMKERWISLEPSKHV